MCLLFETIKGENGNLRNLHYHSERMNNARKILLNSKNEIDLLAHLSVPENCNKGVFKCRVEYNNCIQKIEFIPYKIKKIETLQLVVDDEINYNFKYTDRSRFEELKKQTKANDILIMKNGFITDTSFSNIVFFDGTDWITPSAPLLHGTKRKELLEKGMIIEKEIRQGDLKNFTKAKLVNAMMDMENSAEIEIKNILF
jgi:4-amino-4-deoxychorismate lyase